MCVPMCNIIRNVTATNSDSHMCVLLATEMAGVALLSVMRANLLTKSSKILSLSLVVTFLENSTLIIWVPIKGGGL